MARPRVRAREFTSDPIDAHEADFLNMDLINAILAFVIRAVCAPLADGPRLLPLLIVSLIAGALASIGFRYTSYQAGLKRVADSVRANLLAMRLFRDDLFVSLRAIGGLFLASFLRLLYSLPPLVILMLPFVLLVTHLAMWYEFAPPAVWQRVALEVRVKPDAWEAAKNAELELPAGVVLVGSPLRAQRDHTLAWTIKAVQPVEPTVLKIKIGSQTVEKAFQAGATTRLAAFSPVRPGDSLWRELLFPLERALPSDSPVLDIQIHGISAARNPVFGWNAPWWLTFFVVSIVGALLVKPFVKVQF